MKDVHHFKLSSLTREHEYAALVTNSIAGSGGFEGRAGHRMHSMIMKEEARVRANLLGGS